MDCTQYSGWDIGLIQESNTHLNTCFSRFYYYNLKEVIWSLLTKDAIKGKNANSIILHYTSSAAATSKENARRCD